MPTSQTLTDLGGKKISDLIGDDVKISSAGEVTGTLKHVDSWKEFSGTVSEQSGYYFPVKLDDKYSGKKVTVKGKKQKTAQDLEWVLRVENADSTYTFTAESKEILKLSFKNATFSGQ